LLDDSKLGFPFITLALKQANPKAFFDKLKEYLSRTTVPIAAHSIVLEVLSALNEIPDQVVFDREYLDQYIWATVPPVH